MGILPTFGNIGILIAAMYPAFIVTFLVVASIFNLKINGLIYFFGILITFGLCYSTAMLFNKERNVSDTSCDLFSTLGYHYQNPSFQAAVTVFTYVYLLIPMMQKCFNKSSSCSNTTNFFWNKYGILKSEGLC